MGLAIPPLRLRPKRSPAVAVVIFAFTFSISQVAAAQVGPTGPVGSRPAVTPVGPASKPAGPVARQNPVTEPGETQPTEVTRPETTEPADRDDTEKGDSHADTEDTK
jgi:hypothetical protein